MAQVENTPDKKSSDYLAMLSYWQLVSDLTDGIEAMKEKGEEYLPRFESESPESYRERLNNAVLTNIYKDIVGNLADKPMSKEVQVVEGSETIKKLCEDIDGQGNNLHNFSATYFRNAIDYGVDWIYVDFTKTSPFTIGIDGRQRRKSVAEERASGARPFWVRVPALEMIAVYSAIVNGKEHYVHCRMLETYVERAGWEEITVTQVRELNREPILDDDGNIIDLGNATYRVWQLKEDQDTRGKRGVARKQVRWTVVDEGEVAIGLIPIVPLVIGERKGTTWRLNAAMKDCAYLQKDYYEDENALKNIKKLTAFPMLAANGVAPEMGPDGKPVRAPVGPRAVLYAPPYEGGSGNWQFIEPSATSLTFLRNELKEKAKELRELGRQPLTQTSGQLTTSTSDMAASKGQAAIQRWALALKDALENALFLTALWIKDAKEPTVFVDTSFSLMGNEEQGFDHVQKMRDSGDLSQDTLWEEAKRRRILSDEFEPEVERERLEEEMPEGDSDQVTGPPLDPRTGLPIEEETMSPDPEDD